MKDLETLKKLQKTEKNQDKPLAKFLKYLGKIKKVEQYDEYVKKYIKIPIIEWIFLVLLIRPILLLLTISCLLPIGLFLDHPQRVLLALGSSLVWYLLVDFKRQIFRKED